MPVSGVEISVYSVDMHGIRISADKFVPGGDLVGAVNDRLRSWFRFFVLRRAYGREPVGGPLTVCQGFGLGRMLRF